MADFTLQVGVLDDVHVVDWSDEGNPGDPPRLNSPRHADRYLRVGHAGLPTSVTISAVVAGVVAPVDGALGGRLFQWWWSQRGNGAPPAVVPPAAHSSTATIVFLPENLGTWVLTAFRENGGSVRIGLSVETAG